MKAIEEPRVTRKDGLFYCTCLKCGKENTYATKAAALLSLKRGNCLGCKGDYRLERSLVEDTSLNIYKNAEGFWCSLCSGCGKEQAYTRKEHARSSSRGNWKCKSCSTYENKVVPSFYKEFRLADIESFEKGAQGRGLSWELSVETVPQLWEEQCGLCKLSGMPLVKHPRTWSIDRIDSNRGYEPDNVQLVDKRVNMMKGAMKQEDFIDLCVAIAENHKVIT